MGSKTDTCKLSLYTDLVWQMDHFLPTNSKFGSGGENLDCFPPDKLLADLKDKINKWQDAGEQVIILTDMNKEVMAPVLQKFCQDLHLVEAISTMHGQLPTPTHQRGSRAIDGIKPFPQCTANHPHQHISEAAEP